MTNSQFSKYPADLFKKIQMGAGMFVESFTPGTATAGEALFATEGGANFNATPEFIDYGDGIDNVPLNTKELKDIDSWTVTISGTGKSVDTATVKRTLGAADIDSDDTTKITPRNALKLSDFTDLWWLGPVGKKGDGDADASFIAIHLKNALSTGGFQMQSNNKDKGSFPFEFTAHYSISSPDEVPFDVYVKNPG